MKATSSIRSSRHTALSTSVAILDALKAVSLPAVEIHISAVEDREDFRQISYAGMACFDRVTGEGLEGYAHAIRILAHRLSSEA